MKVFSRKARIGIIVQRYGEEINGGSELHSRKIAERLARTCNVEVFTSCAKSYGLRFENEYPAQISELNSVRVRRYRLEELRPIDPSFSELDAKVLARAESIPEMQRWLRWVGPHCPQLYEDLYREADRFDCFFFFTYLYAPTTLGLPLVAHKSILVPTAHDEPPIYANYYDGFFSKPRHIFFNTEEERQFLMKRTQGNLAPGSIVGVGIDFQTVSPAPTTPHLPENFILYAGRIQKEKGVDTLIEFYSRLPLSLRQSYPLLLIGESQIAIPEDETIRHLGFVADEVKNYLMSRASLFVMPSPFESLCMALLESWTFKVPALVNGESEVLKAHCRKGAGGWSYEGEADFQTKIQQLLSPESLELRKKMALDGYSYVQSTYGWDSVVVHYQDAIESFRSPSGRKKGLFAKLIDAF